MLGTAPTCRTRAASLLLPVLLSAFACGGIDSSAPPATARVSGMVREEGVGTPVAGAVITIGSVTATSSTTGQFEIANAPIGPAINVTATAPGFAAFAHTTAIQAGTNTLTVSLLRNGMYESGAFLLYLPPEVTTYRGVFFVLMGATVDSRPLLRGDLAYYQQFPLSGDVASYRTRLMAFARTHGLAVMGARFVNADRNPGTYTAMLAALSQVSLQSGHAELAGAPLLLHGHSLGGCIAYEFAALHADRAIGFIAAKSPCLAQDATASIGVPGYLFLSDNDPLVSPGAAAAITLTFEYYRQLGALWSLAIERGGGHVQVADQTLLFNWMNEVVQRRLPPSTQSPLANIDQPSGWLADRTTLQFAPYDSYAGDKAKAAWLPSDQTAQDWQRLSGASPPMQ